MSSSKLLIEISLCHSLCHLGIDFRKFMSDDNDSGYKSTYANERTVDEKGSPRGKELAHELEREGIGLKGLGWAKSGLGRRSLTWLGCVWGLAPGSTAPGFVGR